MSYPNHLSADSYDGVIDGITFKWGPNAIITLPSNAQLFNVDKIALKAATEHVAHASAKRLGKTRVRIMYSTIHVLTYIIYIFLRYSNCLLGAHSQIRQP
jgi:hypothetical protein